MNAQCLAHPLTFGPQFWVPTLLKIVKAMGPPDFLARFPQWLHRRSVHMDRKTSPFSHEKGSSGSPISALLSSEGRHVSWLAYTLSSATPLHLLKNRINWPVGENSWPIRGRIKAKHTHASTYVCSDFLAYVEGKKNSLHKRWALCFFKLPHLFSLFLSSSVIPALQMEEDLLVFEDTHFWGITLLLIIHLGIFLATCLPIWPFSLQGKWPRWNPMLTHRNKLSEEIINI